MFFQDRRLKKRENRETFTLLAEQRYPDLGNPQRIEREGKLPNDDVSPRTES